MKKNLGNKKTAVLPQPVYIVTSYDKDLKPNAMTAAWGMQCDYDKLTFILDTNHKTTENIKINKAFTVSLATKSTMEIADYFGLVSGKKENKIEKAKLNIRKSDYVKAPIIEEFPLTYECEALIIEDDEEGSTRVVGKIVNTCIEEEFLTEKGIFDTDKLELITFDFAQFKYRMVGEVVGTAYKDGSKFLKTEKKGKNEE